MIREKKKILLPHIMIGRYSNNNIIYTAMSSNKEDLEIY